VSVPEGHIGEIRAVSVVPKDLHPFPVGRINAEVLLLHSHFIHQVSNEHAVWFVSEIVVLTPWPLVQFNVEPFPAVLSASLCEVSNELPDLSPRIHGPAWKQICVDPFEPGGIGISEAFYGMHVHGSILLPWPNDQEFDASASEALQVARLEVVRPIRPEICS
jgi:hypothetical protein